MTATFSMLVAPAAASKEAPRQIRSGDVEKAYHPLEVIVPGDSIRDLHGRVADKHKHMARVVKNRKQARAERVLAVPDSSQTPPS